jgi:hypothetical protein
MSRAIPEKLLPDRITIRRPLQTMVPASRRPVFEYQTIATGVKTRYNPANTGINQNVLGRTPKKSFRLFLNPTVLLENYEVVRESAGEVFVVTEVKDFFGHHLEATLEEKK